MGLSPFYYEAKMTIREALQLFENLGMHIREGKDTIASFYHEGRLIVRTKVPHKMGELKGKLIHFIRQQMRLSDKEFEALRKCKIYKEDYVELLKQKGKL